MISEDLLEILVCPETHKNVSLADSSLVANLNKEIESRSLKNRGGEVITEVMDAGLIREDAKVLYMIRRDIPIMLIDESIELEK